MRMNIEKLSEASAEKFSQVFIEACELKNWKVDHCEVSGYSMLVSIDGFPLIFSLKVKQNIFLLSSYICQIKDSYKSVVYEELLKANHLFSETSGMTLSYVADEQNEQGYAALNYYTSYQVIEPHVLIDVVESLMASSKYGAKKSLSYKVRLKLQAISKNSQCPT